MLTCTDQQFLKHFFKAVLGPQLLCSAFIAEPFDKELAAFLVKIDVIERLQ